MSLTCYVDGCDVRQDGPSWVQEAVPCVQHGVKHGLKEQGITHPFAHNDVHLGGAQGMRTALRREFEKSEKKKGSSCTARGHV